MSPVAKSEETDVFTGYHWVLYHVFHPLGKNDYIPQAEFSVLTVNYGPSFFPSIYGPSAKRGVTINVLLV